MQPIAITRKATRIARRIGQFYNVPRAPRARVALDDRRGVCSWVLSNGSPLAEPARVHLLAVIAAFGTLNWAPVTTRDVRVTHIDPRQVADVFTQMKSEWGDVVVHARKRTVRITDLPWEIDRMASIAGEIDQPDAAEPQSVERRQKIWILTVKFGLASDLATKLSELFGEGWSRDRAHDRARIWAIIPDDRQNRLIVVADERGYVRVRHAIHD